MNLIAVNLDDIKKAITNAKKNSTSITLRVKNFDHFETVQIDDQNGLHYPHLERVCGNKNRLSDILAARH